MVGYVYNHTRDMYEMYNTETKRVITTRGVKWMGWKMTDPMETLKIFRNLHEEYLVPDIEKENTPTSEPEENPEDKLTMHVIPDEGESVRRKKTKSSEFTYHMKESNTDTPAYDRVLNVLKNLDTSNNPTRPRMHRPVIEGKYKMTGGTMVIPIVGEHMAYALDKAIIKTSSWCC